MTLNLNAALAPEGQQFISTFQQLGWTDEQLRNLAHTWNVAERDLEAVIGISTPSDPHLEEIRTAIIAAQVNAAINLRMTPSTPAILNATPEQTLEFIDYYEAELDRIYRDLIQVQLDHPKGARTGNPEWEALHAQFHRLAGFLWECHEVSGVNNLMRTVSHPA